MRELCPESDEPTIAHNCDCLMKWRIAGNVMLKIKKALTNVKAFSVTLSGFKPETF